MSVFLVYVIDSLRGGRIGFFKDGHEKIGLSVGVGASYSRSMAGTLQHPSWQTLMSLLLMQTPVGFAYSADII
jgi:hypothetical protein